MKTINRIVMICVSTALLLGGVFAPVARAKTLVVMNFKSAGASQDLSVAISELLRGVLTGISDPGFTLVERDQLNEVMKEQGLSLSGVVDEGTSKKLGKILAADFIIVGSVSRIGASYAISARMVNGDTGEIVRAQTASAKSEDEIPEKLGLLAYALLGLKAPAAETAVKPPADGGRASSGVVVKPGRYTYSSWYSDAHGVTKGGKIVLEIEGNSVKGESIESYGRAKMNGTVSGDKIVGYYNASYGYGNFEFLVVDGMKKLDGTYYQVSNGARGQWVGEREE
ncbi:MAG: CsgG/HfaB family protein [Spirochaetota bacterium]